jgi:hypothetical protein
MHLQRVLYNSNYVPCISKPAIQLAIIFRPKSGVGVCLFDLSVSSGRPLSGVLNGLFKAEMGVTELGVTRLVPHTQLSPISNRPHTICQGQGLKAQGH